MEDRHTSLQKSTKQNKSSLKMGAELGIDLILPHFEMFFMDIIIMVTLEFSH